MTRVNHSKSPARRRRGEGRPQHDKEYVDSDAQSNTDATTDDEGDRKKKVVLLADQDKKKRWASWWRRFWMSIFMIGGFFVWLFLTRQTGIVIMVIVLQANIYRELVNLAIRENKERELPGFSAFYVYWFFVALFFIYGSTLMPHLRHHDLGDWFTFILDHLSGFSWVMYTIGIVGFVLSLRERKLYKYQFKQFAFCHMALLVVVFQSTFLAHNVFNGLVWFTLPSGMVVCNDCFAYIFGFFMGKTPLIKLSPKKTWEGFLGGFVMTLIWSFWFAGLLQQYPLMTCPKVGFQLQMADCEADTMPLASMYKVYPLQSYLPPGAEATVPGWLASFEFSPLQVHAVIMAVFASLVAPFGGFFASGFKRAFKIKDFGDSIPGHGGFTDRMDCQIIMGLFVYIYFSQVIYFGGYEVDTIFAKIEGLTTEDQQQLLSMLAAHLGKTVS